MTRSIKVRRVLWVAATVLGTLPMQAQEAAWRPAAGANSVAASTDGLRQRYTTELRPVERRYWAPITEMRWVVAWRPSWNPWAPPQPVYELLPVTRWEERTERVRIAVTKRELVADDRARPTPIAPPQLASTPRQTEPARTSSSHSTAPARGSVGGIGRLESDPPRYGWRAAGNTIVR